MTIPVVAEAINGAAADPERTLLEKLSTLARIDAETPDIDFIKSLPITITDCSSNPRFIYDAITDPVNRDLVEETIRENRDKSFEQLYPLIFGRFHAKVISHISGRVIASAYTSMNGDVQKLVKCGRQFVEGWKAAGIPLDRVCIKISLTGNGAAAAAILAKEGIPVSGTTVFSVAQAVAAQQAGLHSIHLYFNDPVASTGPAVWPDVPDPATQHTFACRHARIRKVYNLLAKQGGTVPLIKTSAFQSGREVAAVLELGADHITAIKLFLDDLTCGSGLPKYRQGLWRVPVRQQMEQAEFEWEDWEPVPTELSKKRMAELIKHDPLTTGADNDWLEQALSTNYLAPGVLDGCIQEDAVTWERLGRKLTQFTEWESKTRDYIALLQKDLA